MAYHKSCTFEAVMLKFGKYASTVNKALLKRGFRDEPFDLGIVAWYYSNNLPTSWCVQGMAKILNSKPTE